ncbi:exodeoxyribonuclease V subunit alpha [Enterobacteriaceae endosymbiont of Donacia tomentosa]|uniref:exodeoxyribonuclease V subunit alpha n=1 Tax=Enterobacteriaceae endosymbiont of Donacia tomentosa TaxID=2675787 RepID=UPI001448C5E9|nr:exodeoxyribonuclease V subunit alpha [Enterobacteriaceae endosymbiont of Donacia tomentosa]QJC31828.1 exodeoxyribonuclease V subunit alpha [Enterobacteriaceae endosymbiont of Donacia tomentosa]
MYYFLRKLYKIKIIRLIDLQFAYILTSKKHHVLMLVIALLSNAIGRGNICLPISKLNIKKIFKKHKEYLNFKIIKKIDNIKNWKKELLTYEIVSIGNKVTPIVIDNNCLYLYRMWREENIIVNYLIKNTIKINKFNDIKNIINFLFKKDDFLQKTAIFVALTHKFSIISGSPGTGKTSIISKLILSFIKFFTIPLKIKIAATTGKASNRLTESINNFFKKKPMNLINKEEKKNIPKKATTIHHLLKIQMFTKDSIFNKNNPLDVDILIIDEASMIDLGLMTIILEALPLKSTLILLGDDYQLTSVESGCIFKDLCYFKKFFFTSEYYSLLNIISQYQIKRKNNVQKFFFRNSITILKNNYRYKVKSGINKLANAIKNENIKKIEELLFSQKYNDIKYLNILNIKQYELMIQSFIIEYKKYFIYLNKNLNNKKKILYKFSHFQIMCAVKNGLFGTKKINSIIERELINKNIIQNKLLKNNWYIGRPIIITKNNDFLNLFNGDIGISYWDEYEKKIKVNFLLANDTCQTVSIENLPTYNIAYAITVHKAQGSEFKNTALILPNKFSFVLTKELIYTAVTRSKSKISIYSNISIFQKTIQSKIKRYSNIKKKIMNYKKYNY